jgi:hypothetical protein
VPRPSRPSIRDLALPVVVFALLPGCAMREAGRPAPPQRALERAGKLQEETHVVHVAGRTETQYRTVPTVKMVTRYEYQCQLVSRPVTRMETTYTYQYDYVTKMNRSVPTTRMVTNYQSQNECRTVPVTRSETQYETKAETRYIPPREHITKTYDKDIVLIEAEPEVLVTPRHRAK